MAETLGRQIVTLAELQIGQPAESDLFDAGGTRVVSSGTLLTALLISKLSRNGIDQLFTGPEAEPATAASRQSQPTDALPATPSRATLSPAEPSPAEPAPADRTEEAIVEEARSALSVYDAGKIARLDDMIQRNRDTVRTSVAEVLKTGEIDLRVADPMVQDTVTEIIDDADPVVARTLVREADSDLARRCVQFGTLAVAVGMRMRLSDREIKDLGRAALSHDWVLFDLPEDQRFPHHTRDAEANDRYRHHPSQAAKLFASGLHASATQATIAAQVHERLDGSGFPAGLHADQIHPLSRVLCVVDTYLTLTSPPKGHPRIVPSDAIAYLVSGMSAGKFAPTAVSGLLETVSLYPLGSLVELNNGLTVRVIQTNGSDYGYPIVQDIADQTQTIDLRESEFFVTRPIQVKGFGEVRLPDNAAA